MKQLHGSPEWDQKEVVILRNSSREIADTASHIRDDVDHTSARVHEQADWGLDPVLFFEDPNVLKLIVVVEAEVFPGQIRDEIAAIVLNRRKDIDQVDVDFEGLGVDHQRKEQNQKYCKFQNWKFLHWRFFSDERIQQFPTYNFQ